MGDRRARVVVALAETPSPRAAPTSWPDSFATPRRPWERWARCSNPAVELVIAHGNGPQVGQMLLRAKGGPLARVRPAAVGVRGRTRGRAGYVLSQTYTTSSRTAESTAPWPRCCRKCACLRATRPWPGPPSPSSRTTRPRAQNPLCSRAFRCARSPAAGWHGVVPSPEPLEVLDVGVIDVLLTHGALVVAAGGGGVPVAEQNS